MYYLNKLSVKIFINIEQINLKKSNFNITYIYLP